MEHDIACGLALVLLADGTYAEACTCEVIAIARADEEMLWHSTNRKGNPIFQRGYDRGVRDTERRYFLQELTGHTIKGKA